MSHYIPLPATATKTYSVLSLIGHGGMGRVYLGEDLRLNRTVALKVIDNINIPDANNRALNEARILARLNHKHIVQIFDVIESESKLVLVMEHVKGSTLGQYCGENPVSFFEKLNWLYQISLGLTAAHEAGIVHCDLKLSNILLDENRQVKIGDFGIAILNKDGPGIRPDFGTRHSMSPEQQRGEVPDFRSDLYSLGVLAFTLFSNPIFQLKDYRNGIGAKIPAPESMDTTCIVPGVPKELVQLLKCLLAPDRESRPENTRLVARTLKAILVNEAQEEVLKQETLPIVSGADKPCLLLQRPRQKKWLATAKNLCIGITVVLILGITLFLLTPAHLLLETPRQIYVLRPVMVDGGSIPDLQRELIVAAIDNAMRNMIINARNMHLIPRSGIERSDLSMDDIGHVSGASDIISTIIDCNSYHCTTSFSLLRGAHWSVTIQKQWRTPFENLSEIHLTTQQNLASLFPDSNDTYIRNHRVRKDSYDAYINLYSQIYLNGEASEATFSRLADLLQQSPHFYSGYSLLRENALELYYQTNDASYLSRFAEVLEQAPAEYRSSIFYTIDAHWLAISRGDYGMATNFLEQLKQEDVDASTLLELKANLFLNQGNFELAIDSYQSALALRPSTKLMYNLSVCYAYLGDFGSAQKILKSILSITKDDYDAKQQLAAINLMQGNLGSTIDLYKEIINNNPQSIDFNNLGIAYILMGDYEKARQNIHQAVALSPTNPTWLLNLADVELLLGNKNESLKHYEQVIALHDTNRDIKAWLELSQAYAHTGKPLLSIKALNEAKKLAPENGEVSFTAALVYSLLGELKSAVVQVEQAIDSQVGIIWFNFPWFDSLCTDPIFLQKMKQGGNEHRCDVSEQSSGIYTRNNSTLDSTQPDTRILR